MNFARTVKSAIRKKGLTYAQVAQHIGKSSPFISYLTTTIKPPTIRLDTLKNLCSALGLSYPEMLKLAKPEYADVIREERAKYTKFSKKELEWVETLRTLPEDVQQRLIRMVELEKILHEENILTPK